VELNKTLAQQLEFLKIADELKNVERQTLLMNKTRQENSAEHSWHIALMAVTLLEHSAVGGVDLCRVLKMLLVHDLVEIYAGDVPAFSGVDDNAKMELELRAADKIFALLPAAQAEEYRGLWEEFDKMETPDSKYAAAVDRFSPFLANHLTDGHTWVKFGATVAQIFERMGPVKVVFPTLWEFVEAAVCDAVGKGYVKP
jgi:putative hydrolase of HD superfamily